MSSSLQDKVVTVVSNGATASEVSKPSGLPSIENGDQSIHLTFPDLESKKVVHIIDPKLTNEVDSDDEDSLSQQVLGDLAESDNLREVVPSASGQDSQTAGSEDLKKTKEERKKEREKKKEEEMLKKYQAEQEAKQKISAKSKCGRWIKHNLKLGEGGYKFVYRGYDSTEAKNVAWCEFKREHVDTKEKRQAMFKETEIMLKMKNRYIVRCFAVFSEWIDMDDPNNPLEVKGVVIIQELMGEGTLKSVIRKNFLEGQCILKFPLITRWWHQILEALRYMHHHIEPPILHRDLKADNCFLYGASDEEYLNVKVGDFGLATQVNSSGRKTMLGTLGFMAPEIFDEKYDEKVDIYAFGMLMLEVTTNRTPYDECDSVIQVAAKTMSGQGPAIMDMVQNPMLKLVISACIHPLTCYRPTAEELYFHPLFQRYQDSDDSWPKPKTLPVEVEPNFDNAADRTNIFDRFVRSLENPETRNPNFNLRLRFRDKKMLQELGLDDGESLEFDLDIYKAEDQDIPDLIHNLRMGYEDNLSRVYANPKQTDSKIVNNHLDKLFNSIRLQMQFLVKVLLGKRWKAILDSLVDEPRVRKKDLSSAADDEDNESDTEGNDSSNFTIIGKYKSKWIRAKKLLEREIQAYRKQTSVSTVPVATTQTAPTTGVNTADSNNVAVVTSISVSPNVGLPSATKLTASDSTIPSTSVAVSNTAGIAQGLPNTGLNTVNPINVTSSVTQGATNAVSVQPTAHPVSCVAIGKFTISTPASASVAPPTVITQNLPLCPATVSISHTRQLGGQLPTYQSQPSNVASTVTHITTQPSAQTHHEATSAMNRDQSDQTSQHSSIRSSQQQSTTTSASSAGSQSHHTAPQPFPPGQAHIPLRIGSVPSKHESDINGLDLVGRTAVLLQQTLQQIQSGSLASTDSNLPAVNGLSAESTFYNQLLNAYNAIPADHLPHAAHFPSAATTTQLGSVNPAAHPYPLDPSSVLHHMPVSASYGLDDSDLSLKVDHGLPELDSEPQKGRRLTKSKLRYILRMTKLERDSDASGGSTTLRPTFYLEMPDLNHPDSEIWKFNFSCNLTDGLDDIKWSQGSGYTPFNEDIDRAAKEAVIHILEALRINPNFVKLNQDYVYYPRSSEWASRAVDVNLPPTQRQQVPWTASLSNIPANLPNIGVIATPYVHGPSAPVGCSPGLEEVHPIDHSAVRQQVDRFVLPGNYMVPITRPVLLPISASSQVTGMDDEDELEENLCQASPLEAPGTLLPAIPLDMNEGVAGNQAAFYHNAPPHPGVSPANIRDTDGISILHPGVVAEFIEPSTVRKSTLEFNDNLFPDTHSSKPFGIGHTGRLEEVAPLKDLSTCGFAAPVDMKPVGVFSTTRPSVIQRGHIYPHITHPVYADLNPLVNVNCVVPGSMENVFRDLASHLCTFPKQPLLLLPSSYDSMHLMELPSDQAFVGFPTSVSCTSTELKLPQVTTFKPPEERSFVLLNNPQSVSGSVTPRVFSISDGAAAIVTPNGAVRLLEKPALVIPVVHSTDQPTGHPSSHASSPITEANDLAQKIGAPLRLSPSNDTVVHVRELPIHTNTDSLTIDDVVSLLLTLRSAASQRSATTSPILRNPNLIHSATDCPPPSMVTSRRSSLTGSVPTAPYQQQQPQPPRATSVFQNYTHPSGFRPTSVSQIHHQQRQAQQYRILPQTTLTDPSGGSLQSLSDFSAMQGVVPPTVPLADPNYPIYWPILQPSVGHDNLPLLTGPPQLLTRDHPSSVPPIPVGPIIQAQQENHLIPKLSVGSQPTTTTWAPPATQQRHIPQQLPSHLLQQLLQLWEACMSSQNTTTSGLPLDSGQSSQQFLHWLTTLTAEQLQSLLSLTSKGPVATFASPPLINPPSVTTTGIAQNVAITKIGSPPTTIRHATVRNVAPSGTRPTAPQLTAVQNLKSTSPLCTVSSNTQPSQTLPTNAAAATNRFESIDIPRSTSVHQSSIQPNLPILTVRPMIDQFPPQPVVTMSGLHESSVPVVATAGTQVLTPQHVIDDSVSSRNPVQHKEKLQGTNGTNKIHVPALPELTNLLRVLQQQQPEARLVKETLNSLPIEMQSLLLNALQVQPTKVVPPGVLTSSSGPSLPTSTTVFAVPTFSRPLASTSIIPPRLSAPSVSGSVISGTSTAFSSTTAPAFRESVPVSVLPMSYSNKAVNQMDHVNVPSITTIADTLVQQKPPVPHLIDVPPVPTATRSSKPVPVTIGSKFCVVPVNSENDEPAPPPVTSIPILPQAIPDGPQLACPPRPPRQRTSAAMPAYTAFPVTGLPIHPEVNEGIGFTCQLPIYTTASPITHLNANLSMCRPITISVDQTVSNPAVSVPTNLKPTLDETCGSNQTISDLRTDVGHIQLSNTFSQPTAGIPTLSATVSHSLLSKPSSTTVASVAVPETQQQQGHSTAGHDAVPPPI